VRIREVSDLHLEYHRDRGVECINRIDNRDIDLLVLSGDITSANFAASAFERFRKRFDCPIALVAGNHEMHKSSPALARRVLRAATSRLQGFHWLDDAIIEVAGRRVLGCTLWYTRPKVPSHPSIVSTQDQWERGVIRTRAKDGSIEQDLFADFEHISGLYDWVYQAADKSIAFLRDNLREGDIVITHFLPSPRSVSPRFQDPPSINTGFFVTDVHALIEERKPALWFHGHTHDSFDYRIGPTRIVCNPMGYPHAPNAKYSERLTITL